MDAGALGASLVDAADPCDSGDWVCTRVYEATSNDGLASVASWLADKPLRILLILVAAFVANRLLRNLVRHSVNHTVAGADLIGGAKPSGAGARRRLVRAEARATTLGTVASSMVTAVVAFFALTSILSVLGVSLAALLASAGVVGVALGFGAQNLVRDVLAGWFILAEDRYGVGDTIDAGAPAVGVVERVTLRSTRLRAEDGVVWHVANGEVLRVGNHSQGGRPPDEVTAEVEDH
jgi:small conductance mechanosensitive channel